MCLAELPELGTAPALTREFCGNSHVSYWPVGALPGGGLADATRSGAPRFTAIAMPIASNLLASLNWPRMQAMALELLCAGYKTVP